MYNVSLQCIHWAAAQPGYAPHTPDIQATFAALKLYNRTRAWGRLRRGWSALAGRPRYLLALSEVQSANTIQQTCFAGVKAVPIGKILGSEGRSADFDRTFSPLRERNRGRWLRIATARLQGIALPPVTLIQVGDVFFVRDGHHRISVARALGEEYVEAEVTICVLAGQPQPDTRLRPKLACAGWIRD